MKKQIKTLVEVSTENEIATVIADYVSNLSDGEYLMSVSVKRGLDNDRKFIFGVEFETYIGELKID